MSLLNGVTLQPEGPLSTIPVRSLAVTPSNTVQLPDPARALYVGTTGNVSAMLMGDTAPVTFVGVPAGTQLIGAFIQVFATNTTASNLIALF